MNSSWQRVAVLSLFFVFGLFPLDGQLMGQSMTATLFPELESLCQASQKDSLAAKLRELHTKEAQSNARAASSWLMPSVTASVDYNYQIEDRQDFNYLIARNDYRSAINMNYPLYHWGAVTASAKAGQEGLHRSKLENKVDLQDQRSQILSAYFELLVKEKRYAVAKAEADSFENQLTGTPAATQSSVDQEDQQLQKTQMGLDLERLSGDIVSLKNKIKKLSGQPVASLQYTFTGFPSSLKIPDAWKPELLRQTVNSLTYQSQAREQHYNAIQARAEDRPQLDAVGGFYQDQVDGVNVSHPVDRNNYFAGISLRWQIFNGYRSDANTAAAHARERRLNALAQQELTDARDAIVEDLRSLRLYAATYDISLAKQKIAQRQFAAQEELKRQGQSSQEAYNTAQRANLSAEANALESLGNFLVLYEKTEATFDMAKNP